MASGNNVKVQLGLEGVYGTPATATKAVKVFSEDFKYQPGKKEEGLLTGNRSKGRSDTMSKSTEASMSFLMRPDDGLFMAMALGVEPSDPVLEVGATGAYRHTFDAAGATDTMPSATFNIDRIVQVFQYTGITVGSFSFAAAPEDYLKADFSFVGRDEGTGTIEAGVDPSTLKAFKFRQATVSIAGTPVADVTDIKFDYNNALTSNQQTTSTGDYFLKPEPGAREITADIEAVYTTATNTLRDSYFKTDDEFELVMVFTSDEEIEAGFPYELRIELPHCQVTDASATVGGADLIKQSMAISAFESTSGLISLQLVDAQATRYLA
jgi:hypothetical protein